MSSRKMFVIAFNKKLKGVVSNKQILWETIKNLFDLTDEELDSKQKCIKICSVPDCQLNQKPFIPPAKKTIYKSHYLYNVFKENKNVLVYDENEENKITIYERNLNDI